MLTKPCFVLTFLFAWTLNVAFGQAKATANNHNLRARIDTVVQRLGSAYIQNPARVGLSIGIIQNSQAHFYNFGEIEKDKGVVPTQHTIYEIGSISKTFTSLLLAHAVSEHKVSLEDDIRKYLKGNYPNLAYKDHPIKLAHLANTTSGLPDNLPDLSKVLQKENPDSILFRAVTILNNYTQQNFYEDLHKVKLDTIPGLIPRHSNVAAQLLGYILEDVYHTSYEELVKKYIEKPLNLKNAANSNTKAKLLATGYNEKGNKMPYFTMKAMEPAGGLKYSATDMLRYLACQLNDNKGVAKLSHQVTWGNINEQAIGLNWNMVKTVDSKPRLLHSGGTFGFASYCEFYPDLNLGIVLLSNESDRAAQDELMVTAEKIVEGVYGVPPALKALQTGLMSRGYEHATEVVKEVKKKYPELHLTEDYGNEWGYSLLRQGKTKQAVEIFKLNVSLYPNNWNTYDSLAEAYETMGNRMLAIKNYKHSLALNPKNTTAIEYLKKFDRPEGK